MAQNGLPELPEAVSKPPEGIVLPPKDIRVIIEKTAGYVARNRAAFEDRIREKEQANPKFSFLFPNDAYAPFYQWRLSEIRSGRGTAVSAGRGGEAPPVEEKPKGPEAPPDFMFSARMPNISALDLEVVKLTALHVARKGKGWMTTLSQRETRNFQFDFLRPQHSLYTFFSRLVDQYTLLLQTGPDGQKAEQARISALQANLQDRFRVLELAKKRSEYVKWKEAQKHEKEEAEEAEKIAYAQIDWHDFVVVETVLFSEADEQADLPPPTTLNDLQSASLEQKAMMSLARPDMRIEEAMPTDDMTGYAYDYNGGYNQAQNNGYNQPQPSAMDYQPAPIATYSPAPPPPQPQSIHLPYQISPPGPSFSPLPSLPSRPETASPHPPAPKTTTPTPSTSTQPPMRIVTSNTATYIPRAQQRLQAGKASSAPTALCPNCGQQIPVAELDNHLRIELLDPRWKEQQAKASARFSTTNLGLAGTDVAANLKRLREKRDGLASGGGSGSDPVAEAAARVLGEQEQQQNQQRDEDEERRKRARLGDADAGSVDAAGLPPPPGYPVIGPDGQQQQQQKDRGGGSGLSVQEQIRQIHQKFKS